MGELIFNDKPKWYAIHTKFRSEKYVANALESKGINCYLPLLNVIKKYTSKVKQYQVPLINNYVFVCITPDEKAKVLQTEYVFSFLQIGKEMVAIPEREIEIMKRVVGGNEEVAVNNLTYSVGEEVEIIAGQLTGLKGKLVKQEGKNKFLVELNNIGFELIMTVNVEQLQKKVTGLSV